MNENMTTVIPMETRVVEMIRSLLATFVRLGSKLETILACTIAGGMGAFISRALDSGSTPVAATAGRTLHWIEAILRWCIGLTAGLAVWLLVTGNIAGSFLNGVGIAKNKNTFAMNAIPLLAGASERLLLSLIHSFDDSIAKKQTPQSATGGNHNNFVERDCWPGLLVSRLRIGSAKTNRRFRRDLISVS
jgi:hypothetical protein